MKKILTILALILGLAGTGKASQAPGFTVNQYDKDENEERGHATLSWTEKPLWWTNTGTWGRLILLP